MSPTPLYRNSNAPQLRPQGGNAGLWYDKFCSTWTNEGGTQWYLEEGAKQKWITTVTTAAGQPAKVGSARAIAELVDRRNRLVKAFGGVVLNFVTIERFVTGLGREHPVENGFAWHHTLGTPYLPGSSVKGLVRAWAETWWPGPDGWPEAEKAAVIKRIFGSEPKGERDHGSRSSNDDKQVGSVIFFDALPMEPVQLECEIMTPHYGPYYQGSGPEAPPPADWHSPTPIPFLVTASGQKFSFAIAPRRASDGTGASDLALAAEWLENALQELGAGAKTAVGYGRFSRVSGTR